MIIPELVCFQNSYYSLNIQMSLFSHVSYEICHKLNDSNKKNEND